METDSSSSHLEDNQQINTSKKRDRCPIQWKLMELYNNYIISYGQVLREFAVVLMLFKNIFQFKLLRFIYSILYKVLL